MCLGDKVRGQNFYDELLVKEQKHCRNILGRICQGVAGVGVAHGAWGVSADSYNINLLNRESQA